MITDMRLRWFLLILALVTAAGSILYKGYGMLAGDREPIIQGIDDTLYYVWLRSAVIDRDLDFTNDLELTRSISPLHRDEILNGERTATGAIPNKYWIGWALVNAVPYVPTYLLVAVMDPPSGITGYEPVLMTAIWSFQLLLGALSLYFAWLLLRRYTRPEAALTGLLLTWLASPLVYYQTARVSLVHNQVFFLVVSAFLLTFRIRDRRAGTVTWILLGLVSGLAVVSRPTSAVYLLFPLTVAILDLRSNELRLWIRRTLLAALAAFLPLALQFAAWKVVYGQFVLHSYAGESFDFTAPQIFPILFSDFHGWLNWHPFLLIGFTAFSVFALRARDLRLTWLASSALIIYVNASWWCYWFGSSFGNRSFEVLTLFAMLGVALLIDRPPTSWVRRGTIVIGCLAIAWNLQLLVGWFTHLYPRDAPVSYPERVLQLPAFSETQAKSQDPPDPPCNPSTGFSSLPISSS